jgi:hypothetical protein
VHALNLIGVYDFQRMNQVIIAYHAVASGEVRLSPELAEYKLYDRPDGACWPAGTGYALADWLRSRGTSRASLIRSRPERLEPPPTRRSPWTSTRNSTPAA